MDPAGTLAVDALTFVVSALLIRAVAHRKAPPAPLGGRPGLTDSAVEGLRFLWRNPTLRVPTCVGTLQSFAGGAVVGQLVVYADRGLGLGTSDARVGLLYTAWSAGGIGGAVVPPWLRRWLDAVQVLLVTLPGGALLGLVVVLTSDWRFALVALTLWASAYVVVLVNTMTYSQEVTPSVLQGRVNTTRRMLSSGVGVPLGALVAGTLTARVGIHVGMSTAVLTIVTAAVVVWTLWFGSRRLRPGRRA